VTHDIDSAEIEKRMSFHEPDAQKMADHEEVRAAYKDFAERLAAATPAGREKSLAFTALEESSFWAHAALAREEAG
jgi:hypothetical protein